MTLLKYFCCFFGGRSWSFEFVGCLGLAAVLMRILRGSKALIGWCVLWAIKYYCIIFWVYMIWFCQTIVSAALDFIFSTFFFFFSGRVSIKEENKKWYVGLYEFSQYL